MPPRTRLSAAGDPLAYDAFGDSDIGTTFGERDWKKPIFYGNVAPKPPNASYAAFYEEPRPDPPGWSRRQRQRATSWEASDARPRAGRRGSLSRLKSYEPGEYSLPFAQQRERRDSDEYWRTVAEQPRRSVPTPLAKEP